MWRSSRSSWCSAEFLLIWFFMDISKSGLSELSNRCCIAGSTELTTTDRERSTRYFHIITSQFPQAGLVLIVPATTTNWRGVNLLLCTDKSCFITQNEKKSQKQVSHFSSLLLHCIYSVAPLKFTDISTFVFLFFLQQTNAKEQYSA